MRNPLYSFFKLTKTEKIILESNVSFYNTLSLKDKQKFEYRVARFIANHKFIGKQNIQLSPAIKVIISSIAIMLTFKMRNYLFKYFNTILIYPKDYLSIHTKKIHRGETNPRAETIVFSWQGFVEGIKIEDDNLNLGIHEFTHALYFSFNYQNGIESLKYFINHKKIITYFEDEDKKQKLIASNYFRDYAFVNPHEFLAVVTENYFETPIEFKNKFSDLFYKVNAMYKIYTK